MLANERGFVSAQMRSQHARAFSSRVPLQRKLWVVGADWWCGKDGERRLVTKHSCGRNRDQPTDRCWSTTLLLLVVVLQAQLKLIPCAE